MQGGERLGRALRGLLARRPVRHVLLVLAVKIFFQVDIPEALVPAAHGERHTVELSAYFGVRACVLSFLC